MGFMNAGLPQQTVKLELVASGPGGRQALQSKVSKLAVGTEVIAQGVLTKCAEGAHSHFFILSF